MLMPDPEKCVASKDGKLLLAAGVACFDMVSGIKVCNKWSSSIPDSDIEDLFKIVLANVHRQSDDVYVNFQRPKEGGYSKLRASMIEVTSDNWLMVHCVFISSFEKKPKPVHYSVGLIFDLEKTPRSPHFRKAIEQWCCVLARAVGALTSQGKDIAKASVILENLTSVINVAWKHSISALPPLEKDPTERPNYNRLLSSHLTTQMTTVIEVLDGDPSRYSHFLAHFLLPYQREMSTLEILDKPCPHLFLQCVKNQEKEDRSKIMASFYRSVTWVKCSSKGILDISQYLPRENVKRYFDDHIEQTVIKRLLPDESGSKPSQFELVKPSMRFAPWVLATVEVMIRVPQCAVPAIAEQGLQKLIRCAICMVATLKSSNGERTEEKVLQKLKLRNEDKELVLSIARLYKPDIDSNCLSPNTRQMAYSGMTRM